METARRRTTSGRRAPEARGAASALGPEGARLKTQRGPAAGSDRRAHHAALSRLHLAAANKALESSADPWFSPVTKGVESDDSTHKNASQTMTMLWNLRHSGEGSASTHKELSLAALWSLQPNARAPRAGRTAGQTSGQPPGRVPMESRRTRRTVRGTAGTVGGRVSGNCGGTPPVSLHCAKAGGCTIRICWPARRPAGTCALARKALNACRAVSRGGFTAGAGAASLPIDGHRVRSSWAATHHLRASFCLCH